MLFTEWNWDDALEVAKEEGWEAGLKQGDKAGFGRGVVVGEAKGVAKVLEYLKQGHTIAEAEALLTN
jgi:uncharacterized protein (DUF433 family)